MILPGSPQNQQKRKATLSRRKVPHILFFLSAVGVSIFSGARPAQAFLKGFETLAKSIAPGDQQGTATVIVNLVRVFFLIVAAGGIGYAAYESTSRQDFRIVLFAAAIIGFSFFILERFSQLFSAAG